MSILRSLWTLDRKNVLQLASSDNESPLPSSPSGEIFLRLERERSQTNDDRRSEEERLNDDADLVERDDDADGVRLDNSLEKQNRRSKLCFKIDIK